MYNHTAMQLDAYFNRIRFEGRPAVDLDTLRQIHRLHLLNISYENLDVWLNRPLDLDLNRSYTKIVERGRGGWCYEMNGLLEWALKEIGFDVMRMNAGVRRSTRGDSVMGNHLVLCVQLDRPWIADVGFGDGAFEPIPLEPHEFTQRGFDYRLEQLDDYWRFHNHAFGAADSFDFRFCRADEDLFARQCKWLSTADDSPFVAALVCQRFVEGGYDIQLGRVAKRVTAQGKKEWLINSADELVESISNRFDLDVPEIASVWNRIVARHEEFIAGKKAG
jgi:N-hydroxyarylamine O-acetyltransferase